MVDLNKNLKNCRLKLIFMALVVFLIFTLVYALNRLFPLFSDDWDYSFVFKTNVRVENLSDLFWSQYNHYFTWGGRSVVHMIAQAMLMLDFSWICPINAMAYVAFIYILYKIANNGNKTNPVLFFLLSIAIWFAQPAFCATVLWKTGAANYLWGTLIVILFIYPYHACYRTKRIENSKVRAVVFFFLGIIAGWTNENIAIGLIIYIILLLYLFRYEKLIIPRWTLSGLVGSSVGVAVMLAAPGNYIRAKIIYDNANISRTDQLFLNMENMSFYFRNNLLPVLCILAILIIVYYKYPKGGIVKRNIILEASLFVVIGLISFLVMIISPMFPNRALFGIITLLIIPIGIIYSNIEKRRIWLKAVNILGITVLLSLFCIDYHWKYETLSSVSLIWEEREKIVEDRKREGVMNIVFTNSFRVPAKYFIYDLSDDPTFWINKGYARFYGLREVRLITKDIVK
ncbi:MAG: DUF6056 family protein [Prevotella sp.]|nr:DUF6056 family protein [Prevotella sp.]